MTLSTKPSAVVFDWDGTLLNTIPLIYRAVNKTHAYYGQPPEDPNEVRHFTSLTKEQSFAVRFGEERRDEALELYQRYIDEEHIPTFENSANHPELILPGGAEILDFFRQRDIPMFVVSNKTSRWLHEEVHYLGWKKYFVEVCGAQDVAYTKPDGRAASILLNAHGVAADKNVWFIGDSYADVACAQNAGLTAVLVSPYPYLDNIKPDFTYVDMPQFQNSISFES